MPGSLEALRMGTTGLMCPQVLQQMGRVQPAAGNPRASSEVPPQQGRPPQSLALILGCPGWLLPGPNLLTAGQTRTPTGAGVTRTLNPQVTFLA